MVSRRSLLAGAFVLPVATVVGSEAEASPALQEIADQFDQSIVDAYLGQADKSENVINLCGNDCSFSDISYVMRHARWEAVDWVAVANPLTMHAIERSLEPYRAEPTNVMLERLSYTWGDVELLTSRWVRARGLYFFPRAIYYALADKPQQLLDACDVSRRIINIGLKW